MKHALANLPAGAALRRITLVLGLMGAIAVTLAVSAPGVKAASANYAFDNGVINLGGQDGTWAKLIDKEIGDPPATLKAEMAGDGSITASQADFFFPLKKIEHLDVREIGYGVLTYIDATIKISAAGPITGNFNTESGDSEVTIPADVLVNVYNSGSSLSIAECEIDGFNLVLNTDAEAMSDPGDPEADPPREAAEYDAAAFDAGNGGKGAMIAPWTSLPNSKIVSGSFADLVCPGLDGMLGGSGGAWLEGVAPDADIAGPAAPKVAPKLTGTPATSTASTEAEFAFTKGDAETAEVTGFQCKLDAGAFEACDSGSKAYSGLAVGDHTFAVKATNSGGEGPVSNFNWKVTGSGCSGADCGGEGTAKLAALKVIPKAKAVTRGKKTVFKIKVRNAGDAPAKAVKVCVKAPKRLVTVKKCVNLRQIGSRKTKTAKFKVTVKKRATKGAKAQLRFRATSRNAGAKNAKATVKVR